MAILIGLGAVMGIVGGAVLGGCSLGLRYLLGLKTIDFKFNLAVVAITACSSIIVPYIFAKINEPERRSPGDMTPLLYIASVGFGLGLAGAYGWITIGIPLRYLLISYFTELIKSNI